MENGRKDPIQKHKKLKSKCLKLKSEEPFSKLHVDSGIYYTFILK
jgi:hypothetical protein